MIYATMSEEEVYQNALIGLEAQKRKIELGIEEIRELLAKPVKPFKPAKIHATKTKKKLAKSINEAASRALVLVREQKQPKRKRNISPEGLEKMRQNGMRLQAILRERREAVIAQAS